MKRYLLFAVVVLGFAGFSFIDAAGRKGHTDTDMILGSADIYLASERSNTVDVVRIAQVLKAALEAERKASSARYQDRDALVGGLSLKTDHLAAVPLVRTLSNTSTASVDSISHELVPGDRDWSPVRRFCPTPDVKKNTAFSRITSSGSLASLAEERQVDCPTPKTDPLGG